MIEIKSVSRALTHLFDIDILQKTTRFLSDVLYSLHDKLSKWRNSFKVLLVLSKAEASASLHESGKHRPI